MLRVLAILEMENFERKRVGEEERRRGGEEERRRGGEEERRRW